MAVSSLAASAQNEAVTNQSVLDLLKEGFSSEEIMGAIENSTTRTITFDINFMRQLKAAGATQELTTYLQKVAKVDNGYEGVMLWNPAGGSKPVKVYRTNFEKEQKGGRRLFPSSMSYTIAGFEDTNASTREMVNFEINTINNNTFEVTFAQPLEPGEYCFFYKNGLNNKYFQAQPFGFDFTVE